jgi:hypothetical protein
MSLGFCGFVRYRSHPTRFPSSRSCPTPEIGTLGVLSHLYQSGDLARIDFAGYVQNLTGHLLLVSGDLDDTCIPL